MIIRHSEIFTKSEHVQREFIRFLVNNIREALPGISVKQARWRIFVENDSPEIIDKLKHVFGVVSFSKAVECETDLDEIKKVISKLLPLKGESFAINSHRLDKNFKLTSQQINEQLGEFVLDNQDLKVKLKNPDVEIGVEIYQDKAFVFVDSFKGTGGLPLGSAKLRVSCDFENDNDVLAAWMMMKRGVIVIPFNEKLKNWSFGFTKGSAVAKVVGVVSAEEFADLQGKSDELLFSPLIGFSEEQLNELKELVL